MRFSASTISILTCIVSAASASDSWSGRLDVAYFVGVAGCAGNANITGYTSGVKAIGDGNICETDHFDFGNGSVVTYYTKWVTICGSQGPLPSAMYQFSLPCTDGNCTECGDLPDVAAQIPWSYFDPEPKRCMTVNSFNASTTDPAKEFASGDFASLIAPSSESFVGSDEDFSGYWDVFLANSCMGPEPNETISLAPTPGSVGFVFTTPAPEPTNPPAPGFIFTTPAPNASNIPRTRFVLKSIFVGVSVLAALSVL